MESNVKISFVGDILVQREQLKRIRTRQCYNFITVFEPIKDLFKQSDYVCGNLETPVAGPDIAPYTENAGIFNAPIDLLTALKELGITFLSTANNHCLDCGVEGALITRKAIVENGFETSGINLSPERNESVVTKNIKGLRCAFLAYTYGTNSESTGCLLPDDKRWLVNLYKQQALPAKASFKKTAHRLFKAWLPYSLQTFYWHWRIASMNYCAPDAVPDSEIHNPKNEVYLERLKSDLAHATRKADVVFLISHSGGQYNDAPAPYTRFITDYSIQHGASHVIGAHSHCPQAIRIRTSDKAVTAWSLGNFCSYPGAMLDVPNRLSEYSYALHLHILKDTKCVHKVTVTPLVSVVSDSDKIARVWRLDDWISNAHGNAKYKLEKDKAALFSRLDCKSFELVGQGEYQIRFDE